MDEEELISSNIGSFESKNLKKATLNDIDGPSSTEKVENPLDSSSVIY